MPKEHSYHVLYRPPSSEVTGLVDCTQLFNVGVGGWAEALLLRCHALYHLNHLSSPFFLNCFDTQLNLDMGSSVTDYVFIAT